MSPAIPFLLAAFLAQDEPGAARMPITLQQCIYLTEKNSLALRIDEVDVQIAKASVGSALGQFDTVGFLTGQYNKSITPSASVLDVGSTGGSPAFEVIGVLNETWRVNGGFRGALIGGASYQADIDWNKRFSEPSGFSVFNPSYTSSAGFSFTQPLLNGFGTTVSKADVLRAKNNMMGAAETLEESRILRAQEVVAAYWNFYFAQKTLETRQFLVEQGQKLVEINRKKKLVGEFKKIDVIEAEAELAQRQQDLIVAESEIGRTQDALKRLIFPFEDRNEWEVALVPLTEPAYGEFAPPDWREAARVAMERRPELRKRRESLKNNDIDIVVAENAILPQLDLNTSLRFNQLAQSKGQVLNFDEEFYSVGAGFSLEMPIGNRTARYNLSIARLTKIQALLDYKNTENQVIQEVRNGVRDVSNTSKEIAAAKEAVRLADERWKQEETRKAVGYSTNFLVRDAQAAWREAVDAQLQAEFGFQIARSALLAAQGMLLEAYGILPAPKPELDDRAGVHFGS